MRTGRGKKKKEERDTQEKWRSKIVERIGNGGGEGV